MSEKYRTVDVTVQQVRKDSIMITVPKMQGWQSIGRGAIHGADERKLVIGMAVPVDMTIRIMEWKADQLHLA